MRKATFSRSALTRRMSSRRESFFLWPSRRRFSREYELSRFIVLEDISGERQLLVVEYLHVLEGGLAILYQSYLQLAFWFCIQVFEQRSGF